jgi:hypothetical protein
MTPQIELTRDMRRALETLFGDARLGSNFLEIHHDNESDGLPKSVAERARRLRETLETYVINMAAELKELGDDEAARLQAEARATLIASREVVSSFPESVER